MHDECVSENKRKQQMKRDEFDTINEIIKLVITQKATSRTILKQLRMLDKLQEAYTDENPLREQHFEKVHH